MRWATAPIAVVRRATGASSSESSLATALERRSATVSPVGSAAPLRARLVSFHQSSKSRLNSRRAAALPVTSVPEPRWDVVKSAMRWSSVFSGGAYGSTALVPAASFASWAFA